MVTTTTILADFVRAVAGPDVNVRSIVPVGASVETYEPTPQDIAAVHDARLLVENGAGLETWLSRLINNAKAPALLTVVATTSDSVVAHNPHEWMDPQRARGYVRRICRGLIAVDPTHAERYRANARRYDAELVALTLSVRAQIATIPPARRVMLVYHDAWRYYDARFGLRTAGVIEPAPGREPSATALGELVDAAREAKVSVVFSEPEESSRLAQALASSLPSGRVVPLSVDTLGDEPGVRSYLGLVRHDTAAIVAALK